MSSRLNQFLEEFLNEWASEIHQNEVNSFLSRMGFPILPSFSGVNPKDWINGIEVYFEVYPSMEIYQFSLVEDLLVGRAKEWVASWSFDGNYDDYWDEFVDALCEHFDNEEQLDDVESSFVENLCDREGENQVGLEGNSVLGCVVKVREIGSIQGGLDDSEPLLDASLNGNMKVRVTVAMDVIESKRTMVNVEDILNNGNVDDDVQQEEADYVVVDVLEGETNKELDSENALKTKKVQEVHQKHEGLDLKYEVPCLNEGLKDCLDMGLKWKVKLEALINVLHPSRVLWRVTAKIIQHQFCDYYVESVSTNSVVAGVLVGITIYVYDPGKLVKRIVKLRMDLSAANLKFYSAPQVFGGLHSYVTDLQFSTAHLSTFPGWFLALQELQPCVLRPGIGDRSFMVEDLVRDVVRQDKTNKLRCLCASWFEWLRKNKKWRFTFQIWDPGDLDVTNKVRELCLMVGSILELQSDVWSLLQLINVEFSDECAYFVAGGELFLGDVQTQNHLKESLEEIGRSFITCGASWMKDEVFFAAALHFTIETRLQSFEGLKRCATTIASDHEKHDGSIKGIDHVKEQIQMCCDVASALLECGSLGAFDQINVSGAVLGLQKTNLSRPTSFVASRRRIYAVVKASSRVDKFSKSDIIVSPSILSANFAKLGEQVKARELAGYDWIHVDVMDGRFVPNITIGPLVVDALRPVTNLLLGVQLMIVEPELRVEDCIKAGANIVSVRCEQFSTIHLQRTVNMIKSLGAKARVVLNPGTSLSAIEYVLDVVDLVLIMSVNPGIEAGATALVAGSAVFGAKDQVPFHLQAVATTTHEKGAQLTTLTSIYGYGLDFVEDRKEATMPLRFHCSNFYVP